MTERSLRLVIGVLALAGLAIAGYLTYVHYAGIKPRCLSSGGCETVQASRYAKLGGVPVATLGLAGYALIALSVLSRTETARLAGAGAALVGFGFSAYLTYRELFTIDAICQWCVASAVIMTALALLTTWRLLHVEGGGARPAPELAARG